jgi:hypothetical protein
MSNQSPVIKADEEQAERDQENARREFLKRCGRFAAVTPPVMTMLLSVSSVPREARASTIGLGNGRGKGYVTGRGRKKGLLDDLLG